MNRNFDMTRQMGNYTVIQRTEDGFFNGNALLRQWNESNPNKQRRLDKFFDRKETKEFIEELEKEIQINDVKNDIIKNSVVIVQKGRKGRNATDDKVWMHPLLFIDFAMYLNPRFKVQVLKFVQDQLIAYRNKVACSYKGWSATLKKLGATTSDDYSSVQRCMNYAIFGRHEDGIRNTATEDELIKMANLEAQISQLVEFDMIKSINDVKQFLKKVWLSKYPTPFTECEIE